MVIGDIPAPSVVVPRLTTRPFPAYRFVPVVHPHPTRDPRGHSYQPTARVQRRPAWQPESWRTLDDWCYGIDLFNAHYFWEAHEAWEGLWASLPRDCLAAVWLQGLIQIAAALLKTHMEARDGVRLLATEGLDKLRHVAAQSPRFMGLDVSAVLADCTAYFAPAIRGELPAVVSAPALRLVS